MMKAIMHQQQ